MDDVGKVCLLACLGKLKRKENSGRIFAVRRLWREPFRLLLFLFLLLLLLLFFFFERLLEEVSGCVVLFREACVSARGRAVDSGVDGRAVVRARGGVRAVGALNDDEE